MTLEKVTLRDFDAADFTWAIRFTADSVQSVLDDGRLLRWAPTGWSDVRMALDSYFALGKKLHSFGEHPHMWADFHEPQITSGLVHFLTQGPHQTDRVIALLRATGISEAILKLDEITLTAAVAEAPTNTGERIDILAYAQTRRGRFGVVIEAKFGHLLSRTQLAAYRKAAGNLYSLAAPRRRRLIVVAPKFDQKVRLPLMTSPEWRFASWERLMVRFEAELSPDADCEDFARFRRTIWHRARISR